MKQRVLFFLKIYAYWILFFVLQKPIFMACQYPLMGEIHASDFFRVLWHAFPLDLSVASYMTAVFGLLLVVSFFVSSRPVARVAEVLAGVLSGIGIVVFISDVGVFPSWGFHLDKTVFIYLASPKEVLACASWWVWVAGVLAMIVGWCACFYVFRRLIRGMEHMPEVENTGKRVGEAFVMLLVTGLLFLPIRGSVTTSTMNTGRVYFSENQMLNQAAVNPLFHIIESLSVPQFDTRRYTYMPSEEAQALVDHLLPKSASAATEKVLTCERPNIVFFILESFSQNAWAAMPNLQRLANEGLYFSRVAASSFRTDRGVVAVLSGFPGQPTSSLMVVPSKSKHLPQIGNSLAAAGYGLKFWYGGDEDFTSMRSYLIDGGFLERVNDHSFPVAQRLSKWGVPDHVLFSRAASEIAGRTDTKPTLDVILSLSSHEPFEVSAIRRYDNPYLNSIAYTDSCIGAFVDTLRTSPAWEKTLLVFVADHGYPYPETVRNYEPLRYAIPVVWAGGAVKGHREIPTLCSQTDVVPTLLAQMGIDHSAYTFGKNSLDTTAVPFAFYSFNDGFALLTDRDTVVIDARADRCIMGDNKETERHARAFMQRVMETIDRWQ